MTAVNMFILDDAAVIFTDSKAVQPGGQAYDLSKCVTMPFHRMALATRGKIALSRSLERILSIQARDFDSAKRILLKNIRILASFPYDERPEIDAWGEDWDIFIAGWSQAHQKPSAFMVANHGGHGLEAWRVHDIEYMSATPWPNDADAVELARHHPEQNIMRLMQAQQETAPDSVGGFVTATYVHEHGISQAVIGKISGPRSPGRRFL